MIESGHVDGELRALHECAEDRGALLAHRQRRQRHVRQPKQAETEAVPAARGFALDVSGSSKVNRMQCTVLLGRAIARAMCERVSPCWDSARHSRMRRPRSSAGTDCVLISAMAPLFQIIATVDTASGRRRCAATLVQLAGQDAFASGVARGRRPDE